MPPANTLLQIQDLLPQNADLRVDLQEFGIDLVLAGALAWVLAWTYAHCGTSLSNRRSFARNFILLAMTTCLIITVVKANIALSLGLVGALSIVRFRSAIKEPEELAYLFIAIAIGLGLGANARDVTLLAMALILGVLWIKRFFVRAQANQNLFLTVSCDRSERVSLEQIVDTLRRSCAGVNLRRFDESAERLEACFLVDFDDFAKLSQGKEDLQKLSPALTISFLENKGLT
jgi:uncharacterized membrane protein YhiD involved in acid resistance